MSFNGLLKHRCTVKRLTLTQVDGLSQQVWTTVQANVRCFIDLTFVRAGKDPIWTPEAGRPSDRVGVLFLALRSARSGDRVEITRGPKGTFAIEGAVDEAWTPRRFHHLEAGVIEVASPLAKNYTPGAS